MFSRTCTTFSPDEVLYLHHSLSLLGDAEVVVSLHARKRDLVVGNGEHIARVSLMFSDPTRRVVGSA